jgi:membrane-bound serine protease (ClpP class)
VTANPARSRGRLRGLLILTILFALLHTAAAAQTPQPKIDVLQVGGALDGTIADYLDRALRRAADEGVEVVVLQLATAGALNVETADLVDMITRSPVPVAVWVGPPGAQVTGGGVQLAVAADVLALAPGAVLGGPVPEALGDAPDTASREQTAQRLADLARARGRDPRVVTGFARDDGAVVAGFEALDETDLAAALPPAVDPDNVLVMEEQELIDAGVADLVAADLPEVMQSLDGREVIRPDGEQVRLRVDPVTATIRFNNQGLLGRVLHAVSTPTLAYLLLVGGIVALLFEWFQPGFGVAGISGVALVALGGFGFTVLPTRWWALALVVVGLILLALDLVLARLGPVTAAGAAALLAGSVWLYQGPQSLRLAGWVIALVVISAVVFFVFVMTTVLRAQGVQARAGMQAVLGKQGVVRSMLNPQGHVFVGGALWRAQAPESAGQIRTGTAVRVTGTADDMTLMVEPVDAPQESEPAQA